ncbi:MAG: FadR family transcriptional regulator [Angelakisella sp.]|jgi:GntR family transcriptional repressor for pyruvate dehydrogenase complex|nr:FadR family transcriptional regulator [Angelakisella sp.]
MAAADFSPVPIQKKSLSDEIVFQIKEMIADGRLKPNQKLPTEQELCKAFSVGRTTVREALMALTALGLVKRNKHNSYVTDVAEHPLREFYLQLMTDHYDVSQLYEARLMLEGLVARLACQRVSEEQLQQLEALNRQMQSDDVEEYIRADIAYHNLIMLAADNRVLYEMYQVIRLLLEKSQREIAQQEEVRATSRAQHREIWEALKKRDGDATMSRMNQHIRSMIELRKKYVETPGGEE